MEITIGAHSYRSGKLAAFQQLHIARRLTPCLGALAGMTGADLVVTRDEAGAPVNVQGDLSGLLGPLTEAIAVLKDEDVEYICNACLDVVERKQAGGGWAPVRAAGAAMYELALPEMLLLTWHVVREALGDFFSGLPSDSPLAGLTRIWRE